MAADLVQEIKLRTDLVELISTYVPLRRSGRTHKGLCPFHAEKTPSFHVDGERGFWRCYGCGQGGDCFAFVQQREGLGFNEAGEFLARRLGLEWVRRGESAESRSERQRLLDVNSLALRFFRRALEQAPGVRAYLERRGLRPETIEEFGLGYAPPGWEALLQWLRRERVSLDDALGADLLIRAEQGMRDRFVDRIIFPIFDLEGRPVAFAGRTLQADGIPKYLNSRETPLFSKSRTLYGLHLAKQAIPDSGFCIVVEGYMDLIALSQAGIRNAVASMGTAVTDSHVGILRRYAREGGLVFCYDGDGAGMAAVLRGAPMFEAAGCPARVASLPEGEDPDTFLQSRGTAAFHSLVNQAVPILDYQLEVLRKRYNLSDESSRLPFVREAARLIAGSGSALTRQEYGGRLARMIERLAEEWYPGDPARALQGRVALVREVNLLLRTKAEARRVPARAAGADAGGGARRGARGLAERYILRAALSEHRWAERVAARVRADHFEDAAVSRVASGLLGNNGGESSSLRERADAVRGDPASAALVSELLIDETPLSEEGLENCLAVLERCWKEKRLRELGQAHAEGRLSEGEPEELRRLYSELGGLRQRRED